MGLKQKCQQLGGKAPSFSLGVDESARIIVDLAADPRIIRQHKVGSGKVRCDGVDACKLCKVGGFDVTETAIVDCYELVGREWQPRSLWRTRAQLDKFGAALPDGDGKCELVVIGMPVIGDDGKPKGSNGKLWVDLAFSVAAASGVPAPIVDADGVVQDGVH